MAFKERIIEATKSRSNSQAIEDICYDLKLCLFEKVENICEMTRKGNWSKRTWWWDDSVLNVMKEKKT